MASETKKVLINGKKVSMVTFKNNEVHPELLASFLVRGAVHARMAVRPDGTKVLDRKVRKMIVKDVFTE